MISPHAPLVLGSASPRRREILTALGIPIRALPADVVEDVETGEAPLAYLERIVGDKLRAVGDRLGAGKCPGTLVADTTVVLDATILGKPLDVDDAERLLQRLVGRTHEVYTRYALALGDDPWTPVRAGTICSKVTLRKASPGEVRRYAETGEGLDKAGAYAAQGIGAFLVSCIEGSYSNVVGLPACEVVLDLVEIGLLPRFP